MPFHAVFFDMDGVLIDSFDAAAATMNDAARELGLPPIPSETLQAVFGQSSQGDVEMFFPGWSADAFDAFYSARFPDHFDLVRQMPGARAILEDLDARAILTAVVTNTPTSTLARTLLERVDVIPHALVTAGDVAHPKPAPDMIFRACQVLDVEPWDVLVVGDSQYDKQAAAAAGSAFAGVNGVGGNFTIERLSDIHAILDGSYR